MGIENQPLFRLITEKWEKRLRRGVGYACGGERAHGKGDEASPPAVPEEGETQSGRNTEDHERPKRSDPTMFLTGEASPPAVPGEGETQSGRNTEDHERSKRSDPTMFLTGKKGGMRERAEREGRRGYACGSTVVRLPTAVIGRRSGGVLPLPTAYNQK